MMAGFGCVSQDASVHFISPLFSMKVSSTPHIQKEWQQIRVREEKKTMWFSLVQNEGCFQFRGHEYNFILAKKKLLALDKWTKSKQRLFHLYMLSGC